LSTSRIMGSVFRTLLATASSVSSSRVIDLSLDGSVRIRAPRVAHRVGVGVRICFYYS
jgi:hypothetical protein